MRIMKKKKPFVLKEGSNKSHARLAQYIFETKPEDKKYFDYLLESCFEYDVDLNWLEKKFAETAKEPNENWNLLRDKIEEEIAATPEWSAQLA